MKDLIVFSDIHYDASSYGQVLGQLSHERKIYFFQTPIYGVASCATYIIQKNDTTVTVIQPYVPHDLNVFDQKNAFNKIIHQVMEDEQIVEYTIWTNTSKAMPHIRTLNPDLLIYDSSFDHETVNPELERELRRKADLVLTSGTFTLSNLEKIHHTELRS
jgi:hypothetical protein